MKKILQHVWEDVKQGESIDVYVSIMAAIILSVLNITGIVSSSLLAPLTLAVLALVSIGILGNRYRLDQLNEHIARPIGINNILLKVFPDDIEARLNQASEVWLFGITFGQFFRDYYAVIESNLKRGLVLKVLLRDPEGNSIAYSAKHSYEPIKPDNIKSLIDLTMNRLCNLQRVSPERLEIRVVDHSMPFGGFAFDPDKPNGALYIQYYPYRMPNGSLPKLVIRPADDYWYLYYRTQFAALWNSGSLWKCQEQKQAD